MKIGIFDPGFELLGHYAFFNRYVAELLDTPGNRIYFLDIGGKMRKSYEGNLELKNPPAFVPLADARYASMPLRSGSLFSVAWWRNRIGEYSWYKAIFSKIADLHLDAVVFSSVETAPAVYFVKARFPYVALVLYPENLFKARASLKGYRKVLGPLYTLYISGFYRFLKRAKLIFTTNEPSMPTPELSRFPVSWLPNRSFGDDLRKKGMSGRTPGEPQFTFLTIGTISNSKNHLFALDSFEKYGLPFKYCIAGVPMDETGEIVKRRVLGGKIKTISGIFKTLDDREYDGLFEITEFLFLPYDLKRGAISSQVMHDAFSRSIPIIAPDVEPFKYYVERYGVGLTYKEGDMDSLAMTLRKAAGMHRGDFRKNFEALHADLSFPKVKEEFLAKIRSSFF